MRVNNEHNKALYVKESYVNKVSINEKFGLFSEEWTPKIIAESNGQLVKIAKGSGELVCLLYTSPSPRDTPISRMPSSA